MVAVRLFLIIFSRLVRGLRPHSIPKSRPGSPLSFYDLWPRLSCNSASSSTILAISRNSIKSRSRDFSRNEGHCLRPRSLPTAPPVHPQLYIPERCNPLRYTPCFYIAEAEARADVHVEKAEARGDARIQKLKLTVNRLQEDLRHQALALDNSQRR
ncbi:hypothetical protein B0H13DRAFT_2010328 [Mycena leptocephala]|nr:hypothetical protein B0H13DRAFT_2010328 [Mycena leptocephala]